MTQESDKSNNTGPTLSPLDALAADGVLDADSPKAASPDREAQVRAWLAILAAAPTPQPSADLLDRTLAAIQQDRMKMQPSPEGDPLPTVRPQWPRRLAEFAAMAIAASIFVAG